jgi:DNA-binding MarR family transcriptional regulator
MALHTDGLSWRIITGSVEVGDVARNSISTSPPPQSGPSLLETFIPYRLSVVANRVSQSIAQIFDEKYRLPIPEWRILVVLDAHEPLSVHEIAELTSMDKTRVSRAHKRLVDLKLAQMDADPEDGRKISLHLTPAGRAMVREIVPEAQAMEEWFLEVLTRAERRTLDAILEKLYERSEELHRTKPWPLKVDEDK